MKGGRGKEWWKWVKSGGEAEQLPTVDRSTSEPWASLREGKEGGKGRGKVMGDGGCFGMWEMT